MLAILLILLFGLYMVFFLPAAKPLEEDEPEIRQAPQMKKLWGLAQKAMKERKPLRAEKMLLTILKFDEKNAAAYNRLGILYAQQKQYKEAIECFEIAQSLDNNASSLHNVGLIYLETEKYEKAAIAFAQAIELEGDLPARYIAYAKALEKLGKVDGALEALEAAYELDSSTAILRHMLEVYERAGDESGILATKERILQMIADKKEKTGKKVVAPKRKILRRRAELERPTTAIMSASVAKKPMTLRSRGLVKKRKVV